MENIKLWRLLFTFLLLMLALLLIALGQVPDENLHIIACDVGQGDAAITIYNNVQIITDGGPDRRVLDCLGRHTPFWDRTVEFVILTHPDADHAAGVIEIIKRFKVNKLLLNPIDTGTPEYSLLTKVVGSKGVETVNPEYFKSLRLGMIYLDILEPDEARLSDLPVINEGSNTVKYKNSTKTNLYSIVYKLSFGKFNALFLGDIPPEVSDRLAQKISAEPVYYIKVPHHGSINGLTQNLLEKTEPKLAVISVGKDNPWGFPSAAILEMLKKYNVEVMRTDLMGDVEVVTDGIKIWRKK